MNSLEDFRKEIDQIDAALLAALGRRLAICAEVAHFKRANNIPMMQPGRVESVKNRQAVAAPQHGLRPEFVREMYGLIIDEACRLEDDIIDAKPESADRQSAAS
jgi:chorismate mutase-like protein